MRYSNFRNFFCYQYDPSETWCSQTTYAGVMTGAYGVGMYIAGDNTTGGYAIRGGSFRTGSGGAGSSAAGSAAGVYALDLRRSATYTADDVGFRCSYTPQ